MTIQNRNAHFWLVALKSEKNMLAHLAIAKTLKNVISFSLVYASQKLLAAKFFMQ